MTVVPRPTAARPSRKDDVIQIRASAETKAMISHAASLRGQKLSEFMLESARARAETALLDQRLFLLTPDAFESFQSRLDDSAATNASLTRLMQREPPWAE
jgi:uncharacterized protein (DUF1778 family)